MLVDDFGIGLIHFWQHWCCSSRSFSGSNRGSLANSFCGFFLSQQAFLSILFFFCSLQDNSKHLSTNQQTNRQRSPVNCTTGICDMREVTAENFSPILTNRWWSARPLQEAAKEDPGNGMLLLLYFLNAKPMMN